MKKTLYIFFVLIIGISFSAIAQDQPKTQKTTEDKEEVQVETEAKEAVVEEAVAEETVVEEAVVQEALSEEAVVEAGTPVNTICPVSKEEADAAITHTYEGKTYAFCCNSCLKKFKGDPEKYISRMNREKAPEEKEVTE